jgi:hypothetical protein
LLAAIFAKPLDMIDPTKLIQLTLALDSLVILSAAIAEPPLRGRGERTRMASRFGLPLPRLVGDSVVADGAADSGKVRSNGVVGSLSRSARLLVVETADVEATGVSEGRDDANASEPGDGRRMRSFSSSSSCVQNVVVVANEAVEVSALPFPPNISIVSIYVFELAKWKVSRLSFACGIGGAYLFVFANSPVGYGIMSGTVGKTLGQNGAVSMSE